MAVQQPTVRKTLTVATRFTGLMADEIVTGGTGAQMPRPAAAGSGKNTQRKDADHKGGGPRYLLLAFDW